MLQLSLNSLIWRFVIVSTLVLGGSYELRYELIKPLIPVFRGIIWLVDPEFTFYSIGIKLDGASELLNFRVNLTAPIEYGGRTINPIGWNDGRQGGYESGYSLAGIFLYPDLLLIGVLAWPATRTREMALRLAVTIPLLGIVLCVDTPSTTLAGLWNIIRNYYSVSETAYGMIWSRFLMGGGGLVIAGALGVCAIVMARRLDNLSRRDKAQPPKRETGFARLVVRKSGVDPDTQSSCQSNEFGVESQT